MLRFDLYLFLSAGVNASFTPDVLPLCGRMGHAARASGVTAALIYLVNKPSENGL